jgi:hypothetical protein
MPYNPPSNTAGSAPAQPAANPSFTQLAQQDINAANPGTAAQGLIAAGAAPGVAQSGLTMAQLLGEIGMTGPSAQETAQYNAQQLALQEAGLGISQGQNTIQQQGLAAQLGLTQAQQGVEQQQYALNQTQYPEQLAEAALANQNAVQQMQQQQAIGGTLNTQGAKQARATQAAQYGWTQEDINRAAANAALGQVSEQQGYQYSLGDIARSQQNLELAAAQNGLSYQQLLSQFGQGASQLGQGAGLEQLYTQYLNQQGSQLGALGTAEGQAGLLVPGSAILNQGMSNGLNLNSLFSGVG